MSSAWRAAAAGAGACILAAAAGCSWKSPDQPHMSPNDQRHQHVRIGGQDVAIEKRHVADLIVTTGRVIIADALMPSLEPLAVSIPPGRYPVVLSRVEVPDDEQRNAFATLQVRDEPPVAWDWAQPERTDAPARQRHDAGAGPPGFPIDSWHAAFMDVEAREQLDASFTSSDNALADEHAAHDGTWNVHVFPNTRANVVSFFSGHGSGVYSARVGRDAAGRVCRVVIDFEIADETTSE